MYHVRKIGDTDKTIRKAVENFSEAQDFADDFCEASNRTEHFEVIEVKQVYVTSTLDEAMKPRTLADRPRVPANFKS